MAQGRLLGLRLFLEGIEVDVITATVSAGAGQPATCTIEVPAADSAHRLKPRTLVHLFFMESAYRIQPAVKDQAPTARRDVDVQDPKNWKLLFVGEVLAISFTKAGALRHNVLQCQDLTNYWSSCQIYWGTGNNAFNSYKNAIFSGAMRLEQGKKKVSSGSALANILSARPSSIPTMSGILGGVVSLLESATGVYDTKKNYHGVNDFMSQAELRLHLTRMIAASGKDDTSEQFVKYGDMRQYFQQVSASTQSTASFMDLAQAFLGKIYYQMSSIVAPPFLASGAQIGFKVEVPINVKITFSPELETVRKQIHDTLVIVEKRINDTEERGQAGQAIIGNADPAKVHGVLHGALSGTSLTEAVVEKDTDGHIDFSNTTRGKGLVDSRVPSAKEYGSANLASGATESERQVYLHGLSTKIAGMAKIGGAATIASGVAVARDAVGVINNINRMDDHGDFAGHDRPNLRNAAALLHEAQEKIAHGLGLPVKTVAVFGKGASRLHTTLLTPDLYMVPPPKCNVLFPDHYMNIQFSRSWLSETTRVMLYGKTSGGQPTMTGYMSPNTSILGGPTAKDSADAANKSTSFLMAHERFTGPIPSMESLGDSAVFRKINEQSHTALNKGMGKGVDIDKDGSKQSGQARYSPNESMQRAANYLFFAKRFASRSMSIEARFCPQIIVGLPMLVLDPMDGEQSRVGTTKLNSEAEVGAAKPQGTHYIGMVTQITHQLAAHGGASTSIQLTKCRDHREGVDLFDPNAETDDAGRARVKKRREVATKRVVTKRVQVEAGFGKDGRSLGDVENPDFLSPVDVAKQLGVQFRKPPAGQTIPVPASTFDKAGGGLGATKRLTTFETAHGKTVVTVGQSKEDSDANYDAEASARRGVLAKGGEPGDAEIEYKWYTATATTEGVSKSVKPLTFTFEATATPPWFSSIYLPSRVGSDFYQEMLGCVSVIDDAVLRTGEDTPTSLDATTTISLPTGNGNVQELVIPTAFTTPALSTTQVAEQLAEAWSGLTKAGADIPQYVETYTSRNYANMLDILGSPEYNPSLRFKTPVQFTAAELDNEKKNEAFHANAFGVPGRASSFTIAQAGGAVNPKQAVQGMLRPDGRPLAEEAAVAVNPVAKGVKGIKEPETHMVSDNVDTRAEKYQAVLDYANEIESISTTTKPDSVA